MRYLIIICLVFVGCVDGLGDPDLRTFDVNEYIAIECSGNGDPWFVSHEFSGREMREIADAIDHMNDAVGSHIELCGVLYTEPRPESRVILRPADVDGYGNYNKNTGDIELFPDWCHSWDHFRKVALHEFGHAIRNDYVHSDNHADIMAQGWYGVTELSTADVLFISRGM